MKDEIKEMIDKTKKCLIAGYDLDIITQEEMGILWNYITNLQEELKSANESISWWQNRFNAVEKENTKLKDLCNKYEEEHSTTFEEWKKDMKIIDELEKYIKTEAKVELYGDKTGFRTFADVNDILNKLNELKGDNK
jgi:hypothetical protein